MDLKRWRNLGIVLGALLVVYMLTGIRQSGYTSSAAGLFDLDEEDVGRIVIIEGDMKAELLRLDTLWVLAGHETGQLRTWRMDAFFNSVLGVERESMISENPAKWDTYGVDSTGRQLQVYDLKGELRGDLMVGRSTTNWQSSYVRAVDADEVYLTRQSIYHFLGADSSFWLEPPPAPPDTVGGES